MRMLLSAIVALSSLAALPGAASASSVLDVTQVSVHCRYFKSKLTQVKVQVYWGNGTITPGYGGQLWHYFRKNGALVPPGPRQGTPTNPTPFTFAPSFAGGPGPYTLQIHDNPNGLNPHGNLFDFTAAMQLCPPREVLSAKPGLSMVLEGVIQVQGENPVVAVTIRRRPRGVRPARALPRRPRPAGQRSGVRAVRRDR